MAATEISAITVLITGATADSGIAGAAITDTVTITGPTGGQLDLNSLMIRVANEATGAGAVLTIKAGGSTYSGIGTGDYGSITVGTAATVWIGGKGLESARFLNATAQSLIIGMARPDGSSGTCVCTFEAFQLPFEITG
jgi:hypothetical protein